MGSTFVPVTAVRLGLTLFPVPALQTGHAELPHPASRLTSPRGCRHPPLHPPVQRLQEQTELISGCPGLLPISTLLLNPKRVKSRAPSLHRHYPASSVQYASLRHPNRPSLTLTSCQLIPSYNHRWGFPCCVDPLCMHAVANTPAGRIRFVRSYSLIRVGLPSSVGGASPALYVSRPAQRSLGLQPVCSPSRQCDPLHRRLQTLRCLHACPDCYRVERTSSRAGIAPAVDQHLFTAHNTVVLELQFRSGPSSC
jgi:hypothetical protein